MDTKGKVLVTGANGFLATNAIAALIESGYQVRGLLRRKGSYIGKNYMTLELMEGSFTDDTVLDRALEGCFAAVHIAALTDQAASDEDYRKINVEASLRFAKKCICLGIRKFIYVSSANAFAYGSLEHPGDESAPTKAPFTLSSYAMSKAAAQRELLELSGSMDITVVNPTFMIGPMDIKPSSGRIIMMGYGRRIMVAPPGGKNFVHVGDVAKGIVAALEKGGRGETYLLAGQNMSYRDFYRMLAKVSDKRMLIIGLHSPLMLFAGHICDFLARIGIRTDATLTNMKLLCVGNYYSNSKASLELGLKFRSAEEAVRDAVKWFKANHIL